MAEASVAVVPRMACATEMLWVVRSRTAPPPIGSSTRQPRNRSETMMAKPRRIASGVPTEPDETSRPMVRCVSAPGR